MRHIAALGYLIAWVFASFFALVMVGMAADAFRPNATLADYVLSGLMGVIGLSLFISFPVGAVACYLSGRKRSYLMALPWLVALLATQSCEGQGLVATLSPYSTQLPPRSLTTR